MLKSIIKKTIALIFLLLSLTAFSQEKESINVIGSWMCTNAELHAESSDSRIEKYITLFKGAEFLFNEKEGFVLKQRNSDSISQTIIDSYWKFNQKNQIVIDYRNPSSILKIIIETKEEEIYFLLFDKMMSLKMEKIN